MTTSFAAQVNSIMAALILLTAFGLLTQRRILGLLHLFAWQGLFLSISTAIVGFVAGKHHLYISSVLTLSLKVVLLPYILHVLILRLKIQKEVETIVNVPLTMLIGIALSRHATRNTVVLLASLVVIDLVLVGSWFGVEKLAQRGIDFERLSKVLDGLGHVSFIHT